MWGKGPGCGHFLPAWGFRIQRPRDLGAWSLGTSLGFYLAIIAEPRDGVERTLLVRIAWESSVLWTVSHMASLICGGEMEVGSEDAMPWMPQLCREAPGSQPRCSWAACSPSLANLCLRKLERGQESGPGVPRDSRIL